MSTEFLNWYMDGGMKKVEMVLGENGMGNYYLDCCIVNLVLCDELDDNLSDDNE